MRKCKKLYRIFCLLAVCVCVLSVTTFADDVTTETGVETSSNVIPAGKYRFNSVIEYEGYVWPDDTLFFKAYFDYYSSDVLYVMLITYNDKPYIAYSTSIYNADSITAYNALGWSNDDYRYITIVEDQTVDSEFYRWFVNNTICLSRIDTQAVGYTFDAVLGAVTDFAEIVSGNALMLLFAVILPVISFGGGFLIRLKHRT